MGQFSKRLAEEVERVLREHGYGGKLMTLREAESRCRINYTTIGMMLKGRPVKAETLAKFAVGFGEDKQAWLSILGYEDDGLPFNSLPHDNPEHAELIRSYERLPEGKKPLARQLLAGLAS